MSAAAALCYHPNLWGVWGVKICPSCFGQFADDLNRCAKDAAGLLQLGTGERIGKVVDQKLILLDLIGQGGQGKVYRARHVPLKKDVAVKILSASERGALDEAQVSAALVSPHTAHTYDFGYLDTGEPFIAMELVRGLPLDKILKAEGALAPERAVHILTQVCAALEDAHKNGVFHRDLKPANIMVDRDGDRVKVLDFGLAKARQGDSSRVSTSGTIKGTTGYMATEQWDPDTYGPVGVHTDIYALGATLFEMLSNHLPFRADSPAAQMRGHLNDLPPRLSPAITDHDHFDRIIARCMAKRPSDRYGSVAELCADLVGRTAIADDVAAVATPFPVHIPAAVEPAPSRRFSQTVAFLLFALITIATGLFGLETLTAMPEKRSVSASSLAIQSEPSGARVLIDGEPTGLVTPTVLDLMVAERAVQVSVEHEGHLPATKSVVVHEGAHERLVLSLSPSE
jgi:serine/threonine-protein kinase